MRLVGRYLPWNRARDFVTKIGEGRFKMTWGKLLKIRKGIHLPNLKAKLDEKLVNVYFKA